MDLELQKSPFRNRLFCTRHSRISSLLNTPMSLKGKEPSSLMKSRLFHACSGIQEAKNRAGYES